MSETVYYPVFRYTYLWRRIGDKIQYRYHNFERWWTIENMEDL